MNKVELAKMIGLVGRWIMFYDDYEEVKLTKWTRLQPKSTHTGCAIVVDIVDTHQDLVNLGYSPKSYVVQTDFGNTFKLTEEELLSGYYLTRVEEDPFGRIVRQMELLQSCMDKYYVDLIK